MSKGFRVWRSWTEQSIDLGIIPRADPLYCAPERVGIVVGSFAAVPYVHLQLESRKRHFAHVPMLVHDDASPHRDALLCLTSQYGAHLSANSERLPHHLGDLSAFVSGIYWAQELKLELLLKVSRRWIWTTDWTNDLVKLAAASQYPTFSNITKTFGFGFRTECLAMSVAAWSQASVLEDIKWQLHARKPVFVEAYMHNLARSLERSNCFQAEQWRTRHARAPDQNGYAVWDFMGTDRKKREPTRLWHDCDDPQRYAELARAWELPYQAEEFVDPNAGLGSGPAR